MLDQLPARCLDFPLYYTLGPVVAPDQFDGPLLGERVHEPHTATPSECPEYPQARPGLGASTAPAAVDRQVLVRVYRPALEPAPPCRRCLTRDQGAAPHLEDVGTLVLLYELVEESTRDVVGLAELLNGIGRRIDRTAVLKLRHGTSLSKGVLKRTCSRRQGPEEHQK